MRNTKYWFFSLMMAVAFSSCQKDYVPKPYSYFRIDLPEKKYKDFSPENAPYQFELPVYSLVTPYSGNDSARFWYNVVMPQLSATIHISYVPLGEDNLRKLLDETYELAYKHQVKASSIDEELIQKTEGRKYGIIYHIRGNAASPIQFFVTDSSSNFLRGALYFDNRPNIDSIAPVLDFVEKDVYRIIESLQWKNGLP